MPDYLEKAISCIRNADNLNAMEYLHKALELDKNNPEIFRNMGLAAFNLGNYQEAEKHWKKALQLDPNHHMTWWCLGNLYEGKERFYEAFEAYEEAEKSAKKQRNEDKAKRYREWKVRVKTKIIKEK
ncbi:MAG: tetratricopeptide repeat protein [Candidatus Hodarchaeales archaeon]